MDRSWFVLSFLLSSLIIVVESLSLQVLAVDKTAVVSTISPFDAVTTDERAPVHLSEIFRRALQELVKHNAEHPNDLWAPPEHIWMLLSKTGVSTYWTPFLVLKTVHH